jgi:hypothetical protein
MPFDKSRYPRNWDTFTHSIKQGRAKGRCECTGQCRLHQPNPRPRRCIELHQARARYFRGKVILTTAHLCACEPPCADPAHVIAACQRCHLRIDAPRKGAARRAGRPARVPTPYPPLDLSPYDAL